MTTHVDHLVIAADSLSQGQAWCERTLGVRPVVGGRHALMGTHNLLLQLSTARFERAYLEIIAIDPAAPRPKRPRWFGLDTRAPGEPQLVQVVARSSELDALRSGLMHQAVDPGEPLALSRGELSWRMLLRPDGQMPQGLPMLIEWGAQHPAQALPASGCGLEAVTLSGVRESLTYVLGLHQVTLQASAQPAWSVRLKCPLGLVDLHSHRSIA